MQADALHSLLHALGALVGLAGVNLAGRPADRTHPYGYERNEPLAAIGLVAFMLLAVYEILAETWTRLLAPTSVDVTPMEPDRDGAGDGGDPRPGADQSPTP